MKTIDFLKEIEAEYPNGLPTNKTTTGMLTIKQTLRNTLRAKFADALGEDLASLLSDFDIAVTANGVVVVAEIADQTVSFELKVVVRGLDYDPFIDAMSYADEREARARKKESRS